MKKTIITLSIVFTIILLIAVVCVAVSPDVPNVSPESSPKYDRSQAITFTTLDNSVTFDSLQVESPSGLSDILYAADIQSLTCETYSDSNVVKIIGTLDKYRFVYHYTFVSPTTKINLITVKDTITGKEVCISKYDKFSDNLKIYRELSFIDITKN